MTESGVYQFSLDWDVPSGLSYNYQYPQRQMSSICASGLKRKGSFGSRVFWFVLGAGATFWWMRARQAKERQLLIEAVKERRRREKGGRKRREWVLSLEQEDVEEDGDDAVVVPSTAGADLKAQARKVTADASETVVDLLEVVLESLSSTVDNLKTKLTERRRRSPGSEPELSGSFSPVEAHTPL